MVELAIARSQTRRATNCATSRKEINLFYSVHYIKFVRVCQLLFLKSVFYYLKNSKKYKINKQIYNGVPKITGTPFFKDHFKYSHAASAAIAPSAAAVATCRMRLERQSPATNIPFAEVTQLSSASTYP